MPKLVSTNSVALDEASNAFVSRSTWTCEETLKVYVWISMKYRWAFINIMTLYFIYCRDESDPLLHDARLAELDVSRREEDWPKNESDVT